MVDGGVAGLDPADLRALMHLQRECEPFGTKPQPDAARRARLGKARENIADGGDHGLVGVEADYATGDCLATSVVRALKCAEPFEAPAPSRLDANRFRTRSADRTDVSAGVRRQGCDHFLRGALSWAPCAVEKSLACVASPAKKRRCSKGRARSRRATARNGEQLLAAVRRRAADLLTHACLDRAGFDRASGSRGLASDDHSPKSASATARSDGSAS